MGPDSAHEPVDCAHFNRIMRQKHFNHQNSQKNHASRNIHPLERRIQEAEALPNSNPRLIASTMVAKRIPDSIRPLHTKLIWTGRGLVKYPLPHHYSTWLDLNNWMTNELVDEEEDPLKKRMDVFQAVHFLELEEEKNEPREDNETRMLEETCSEEKRSRLAMTQGNSAEQLQKVLSNPRLLFSRTMQRANDKAAKDAARLLKPWKPSLPCIFAHLPKLQRIIMPNTPGRTQRASQISQSAQRTLLPSPPDAKPAARDSVLDSASQSKIASPQIFRSPELSLEDMPPSALPIRMLPRNAVEVLSEGKVRWQGTQGRKRWL
jgi:hypothetical protein